MSKITKAELERQISEQNQVIADMQKMLVAAGLMEEENNTLMGEIERVEDDTLNKMLDLIKGCEAATGRTMLTSPVLKTFVAGSQYSKSAMAVDRVLRSRESRESLALDDKERPTSLHLAINNASLRDAISSIAYIAGSQYSFHSYDDFIDWAANILSPQFHAGQKQNVRNLKNGSF